MGNYFLDTQYDFQRPKSEWYANFQKKNIKFFSTLENETSLLQIFRTNRRYK